MSQIEAFHGGAFFDAIGVDLRHLERSANVISADVLDAWFDPSPRVIALLREYLPFLLRTSPPNHAEGFVQEVARLRGVAAECVLPGSGSSSLLFACLPRLLPEGCRALLFDPMYSEYEHIAGRLMRGEVLRHTLSPDNGFAVDAHALLADVIRLRPDALLLVNPNNPTGRLWPRASILPFLDQLPPSVLTVIDETYLEYTGAESLEGEAARRPNLIVIKSMSKVYALSGARVAYLVTHPDRAELLRPWLPPWPVGLLAQAAAMEALRDPGYYAARYAETQALREGMAASLAQLSPFPSSANFFLIRPRRPAVLAAHARGQEIFLREFRSGLLAGEYLRISVKDAAQNARIVGALR
ncbi:MAG: histidinol-phosphate aminotransferase family protein [Acidobacteria bacterium]|nr:histidinol-phosphate aminotransferase family protein [Acidobacteriota bacterium]